MKIGLIAVETSKDGIAHVSASGAIVCSLRKSLFCAHFVKKKIKTPLTVEAHDGAPVIN